MSLLGDVVGGVFKVGFGIAKFGFEALVGVAREADTVRKGARGMSDQDLLNGIRNTSNSIGTRAGYAQALKDRHRR